MKSLIIDLSKDISAANEWFALDTYLPDFAKKAIQKDAIKVIKTDEVRKQLKKIRTELLINDTETEALTLIFNSRNYHG